jgi:hypothetical protein
VLLRAEPQGHGQRVQHGERRAGAASLLEPGVPGGADVRQLSDLLPAQARRAAPDARRQPGGLGVRSAGWLPPATPALDTDVGRPRSVLETNVVGSFIVTKHAAPVMIRGGGGRDNGDGRFARGPPRRVRSRGPGHRCRLPLLLEHGPSREHQSTPADHGHHDLAQFVSHGGGLRARGPADPRARHSRRGWW